MRKTGALRAILSFICICANLAVLPAPAQTANPPQAAAAGNPAIPSGHKFIMELETPIHTRTSKEGDTVEFITAADIVVAGKVLVPNRSSVRGVITKCKRAGRLFGRSEVHLKIEEIRLPDGRVLPMIASIIRVGFDPVDSKKGKDPKIKGDSGSGGDAGAIVKGGAQGAIIGVISGGPRGAMYGSAAGAAITAVGMLFRRGADVDLPRSTMFEARFDEPLEIPNSRPAQDSQVVQSQEPVRSEGRTLGKRSDAIGEDQLPSQPRPVLKRSEAPTVSESSAQPPELVHPPTLTSSNPPVESEPDPVKASGTITLSVKVRMVQVDAVVRDRKGRILENLSKDDFRIFEDGVPLEIQSFSRDELPLAVALVIDRSGSVSPYISELRRIGKRALDQLKPKDEVALFSFARDVQRIEDLTTDRERIAAGLDSIRTGGETNIVDAISESVEYLDKWAPERRHAVILISDNQVTVHPQTSEATVIRKAMESETVIYSLKTSGQAPLLAMRLPSLLSGKGSVGKMTEETGGEIIDVNGVSSLDSALASVIARLRMRYTMGYHPPSTSQVGAYHSIEVRLIERHGKPDKDYKVHARRGYYARNR